MSTLISYLLCVRYFVRFRRSRGDLKVCIFQRLHSNLLQVGDGIPEDQNYERLQIKGIGNRVCVCVENGKLQEQHTELLWGATSYLLLLHPHGHEDEGKDTDVVVPIAGGKIISLKGSRACLVHTCFPSKLDAPVLAFNLRLLESHTGRQEECNLSFLHCFKNNAYKYFMFSWEIWHLLYASYIRIWRGHQRKS